MFCLLFKIIAIVTYVVFFACQESRRAGRGEAAAAVRVPARPGHEGVAAGVHPRGDISLQHAAAVHQVPTLRQRRRLGIAAAGAVRLKRLRRLHAAPSPLVKVCTEISFATPRTNAPHSKCSILKRFMGVFNTSICN